MVVPAGLGQRAAFALSPCFQSADRLPATRSSDTLQNLTLELATMGDLKLVERLQQYTLAPGASKVIRANIKVRSRGQAGRGNGRADECCLAPGQGSVGGAFVPGGRAGAGLLLS